MAKTNWTRLVKDDLKTYPPHRFGSRCSIEVNVTVELEHCHGMKVVTSAAYDFATHRWLTGGGLLQPGVLAWVRLPEAFEGE